MRGGGLSFAGVRLGGVSFERRGDGLEEKRGEFLAGRLTELVDKVLGDEVFHEVVDFVGAGIETVVNVEEEDGAVIFWLNGAVAVGD